MAERSSERARSVWIASAGSRPRTRWREKLDHSIRVPPHPRVPRRSRSTHPKGGWRSRNHNIRYSSPSVRRILRSETMCLVDLAGGTRLARLCLRIMGIGSAVAFATLKSQCSRLSPREEVASASRAPAFPEAEPRSRSTASSARGPDVDSLAVVIARPEGSWLVGSAPASCRFPSSSLR